MKKTNKWDIGRTEDASDFKIQVHMKNGDEYFFTGEENRRIGETAKRWLK